MLKALLYTFLVNLAGLICTGQPSFPDWSTPSETVTEDPHKRVTGLTPLVTEGSKVMLTWKVGKMLPEFFAIERSENGKNFEVVAVLNHLEEQPVYQWTDDAPGKGRNLYRLRYSFTEGHALYSGTVPAVIAGNIELKFYPNPVDHVLIIRSESLVDVLIVDGNGKVRLSIPGVHGLQTVNVSNLEKGIYIIRFTSKLTGIISQEKLVKN